MKKLNFRITNPNNLIAFLKKIKIVNKSVILEMDESNIFAKVRMTERTFLKFVKTRADEFFEGDKVTKRIKIGIVDISKLIDVFKYFGAEEEISIEFSTGVLDDSIVATSFSVYSASTDIKFKCADIGLIGYIEDDVQAMVHSSKDAIIDFPMSKESFIKISNLTTIENNQDELLNFDVNASGLSVNGNSFQHKLIREKLEGYTKDETFTIFKYFFNYIDQENSHFYIQENRIVVLSEETDGAIAIGLVGI
jgi:hypothetical protein